MLKKIIFSLLASLVMFFSFAPYLQVNAASPAPSAAPTWYNQSFGDWWSKVYDPNNPNEIFGERYTAAQVQWVVYGLFAFLINSVSGPQNSSILSCVVSGQKDPATCIKSITGITGDVPSAPDIAKVNMWKEIFATNRPISGIAYVKDTIQNFNLVPTARAQTVGFGFTALQPIQSMWRAVRDVSYGFFVIAAIVLAFMIMFRVKINPQTVITVQSAIPKIIIALILVTFSYAIAGLLIDLMYVVIGLVSLIATQFIPWLPAGNIFNFLTLGQPVGWNIQIGIFAALVLYLIAFFLSLIILILFNFLSIPTVGALILGGAVSGVLLILAIIIIAIAILISLWISIKTVWSLLKAFVNIILLTIFAPLQIVAGIVIPNLGFGQWIKSFVSNLAVFVVTGVLLLFAYIFLVDGLGTGLSAIGAGGAAGIISKALLGQGNVGNPFSGTSNAWPPLLGSSGPGWTGLLLLGVSFVLFTLIPKANEIIQGLLSGRPFAYGTAIGEALGPITGPAKFGYGLAQRPVSEAALSAAATQALTRFRGERPSDWRGYLYDFLTNLQQSSSQKPGGPGQRYSAEQ